MTANRAATSSLFDSAGRPLRLGAELGKGGEGSVFELRDAPSAVAKLYHEPPSIEKAAKIRAMASLSNERLLRLAAWPTTSIHTGRSELVGFVMPKLAGHKAAFNLYSPKLRLQEFPTAGWAFLIRTAANTARAFAVVHESGHVIGDVNHGNLVVGGDATVKLIDCDSFQVAMNGTRWLCEVGVATHQPPELQMVSFKGIVRTPNHDNFGLAVLIFQLLFMARHPFSGRFLGTDDMPMERAIKEYRFAYGANAAARQMKRPPGSLGLEGITQRLALMFERAFAPEGSRLDTRPRAREWADALQELEGRLKKCTVNSGHQFFDGLTKCPWCDIEAVSGLTLFPVVFVGNTASGFSIAAIWQQYKSIPDPGSAPPLPCPEDRRRKATARALEARRAARLRKGAVALLALVTLIGVPAADLGPATGWVMIALGVLGVVIWNSGGHRTLQGEIAKEVREARGRWNTVRSQWSMEAGSSAFQEKKSAIEALRREHDRLPQERMRLLQELEANKRQAQFSAFLDRWRLDHAHIKGIGDAKKATLQSYGIETAADIVEHRIVEVPGFGPVLFKRLNSWRQECERRFVFDASKAVDPAAKRAVEQRIATSRIDLERKLAEAVAQLSVVSQQTVARRQLLLVEAERAAAALAQAEADEAVL